MNMDTQCGRADQDSDTYDANERIGRRDWGQHHTDGGSKSTQVAACKGTYSKQGQRVRRHHCRRFPALSARVLLRAPVSESALKLFGPKSVGTVRTHRQELAENGDVKKKTRDHLRKERARLRARAREWLLRGNGARDGGQPPGRVGSVAALV